jgi:hypothetical protein
VSEPANPTLPALPADLDAADALRQTYLHHFDEGFQTALVHLLQLFEGLRFFEGSRRPSPPASVLHEAYEACLADLRHVAGELRGLGAEYEDDELSAEDLRLVTAAAYHGGRLRTLAEEIEAELREARTPPFDETAEPREPAPSAAGGV